MARPNSGLRKKTRLQNVCLTALLLLLPLLYLLHVHVARNRPRQDRLTHRELVIQLHNYRNVNNHTSSLGPPATVRRILVRDLSRGAEHGSKPLPSWSVYDRRKMKCKSRICRDFLSKTDLAYFGYCWRKTELKSENKRSACKFLNATGRPPIALASFPGSGNTWVRGLLQLATGVCTGGIYCDTKLRISGYPGESLRSGKTLVVKTHQPDPRWTGVYYPPNTTDSYFTKESDIPLYDSAILLVRNPFHAIVAEWNRFMTVNMSDNHISILGPKSFMYNPQWNDFVHTNAVAWQDTVLGWVIKNHNHPVMVVKYEDLKRNVYSEVMMMLDFLEFPYSITAVSKRLKKEYNEFHRAHSKTEFEHFTPEQKAFVTTVVRNTLRSLDSHGLTHVCDIRDYLIY